MASKKKRPVNDEFELDRAYAELTGYDISPKKKKSHPILGVLLILVLALGGCALGIPFLLDDPTPTAPPVPSSDATFSTTEAEPTTGSVQAAGLDLSGMTESELRDTLNTIRTTYLSMDMTVSINGQEYPLSPADTGADLDIDGAVSAILEFDGKEFDLIPYVVLDTAYLQSVVDGWRAQYNTVHTETTYTITGEMPSLTDGADAQCQTLAITKGIPESALDCEVLYEQILAAYYGRTFLVTVESAASELAPFDLAAVYNQCYIAPQDAVMNMSTFAVTSESCGYDFDLEAAQALLEEAAYGETVEIPFRLTAPGITAESLSGMLYRDVLASYSTAHTNDSNRNNNLRLACAAINGKVLYPGETFSYNNTLGKRTTEKGYLPAGAYLNGQVVSTVGGGICQVSSTLYYCTLVADLQIVSRRNHGLTVSYVPLGMDATVDWGNIDFKFKNNTSYPIRIEAWVSGGYVTVQIVGTDEKDYTVKMEYVVNETYNYSTVYTEMYADNEAGYRDGDVITSPYTGYKVTTYKCKYSKATGELISRTFEATSKYKVRDKVVAKVIERPTEPPETEPTEPETEPTEPETEPTEPETEPTEPETEPTEPVSEPTVPETTESNVPETSETTNPNP